MDIDILELLKKIINIFYSKNNEMKSCPFCGRLPEPELFSYNSIKDDSWCIFCDCGKAQVKDCKSLKDCLIKWNERV